MKKTLFILAIIAMSSTAHARIEIDDCQCTGSIGCFNSNISRMVTFYDDETGHAYYMYWLDCNGNLYEDSKGSVIGIGALPSWAFPWQASGSVNSSGVWIYQVFSGGHLAATIEYDQIPGHSATMTTYPNPLQ